MSQRRAWVTWDALKGPPVAFHTPFGTYVNYGLRKINGLAEASMAEKKREEVIERAAAAMSVGEGRMDVRVESYFHRCARALADAGLLVTPEIERCVSACRAYYARHAAKKTCFNESDECRAAGAALAPKEPWSVVDCRSALVGDHWIVCGPHQFQGKLEVEPTMRFEKEADARLAAYSLNAAWAKR